MSGFVTLFADLVAFWAFVATIAVLFATPTDTWLMDAATRGFLAAGAAIWVYSTAADLFEGFLVASKLNWYEGYVEMLFPALALMAVYSAYAAQQLGDMASSRRALAHSHDLMMTIVDAAPAGIMLLDDAGNVTFANETARDVLDLAEDPDTGRDLSPGWTIHAADGGTAPGFSALVNEAHAERVPLLVEWPSGWRVELQVSTEPLRTDSGALGGTVATFEPPIGTLGRRDRAAEAKVSRAPVAAPFVGDPSEGPAIA